eukprot:TRINITY_DN11124_c0_g1_i4.p2 TRINITY_DN11124_c0_g1~~TRINITY_DN11124_c0_g1_i4.p2  ORF type:complete len:317 (-),score=63.21 TRINITY_DN11124_c0_g1_i4:153-1103(-)
MASVCSINKFQVVGLGAKGKLFGLPNRKTRPVQRVVEINAALNEVVPAVIGGASSLVAGQDVQQIVDLAASDNRFGLLTLLALPALGWVAFNIGGPALNQLDNMSDSKKAIPFALGLTGLSLVAAQQVDAASLVGDMAASDNRFGLLLLLGLPVLAWVAFNIGGPALNQLDSMGDSKKAIPAAAGLGLGASLLAAQQADAAQQMADFAASDNRFGLITLLALPVLGWVAFNIAGPALNQLDNMSDTKKVVPAGIGLGVGASLLAAQQADAMQQVADLATSDNRFGLILLLGIPVLGWVAFNILGPALNQLDDMKQD